MKNFIKQIASLLFLVIVAFLAVGYFLNYQIAGELSFTPRDILVYSTSDLSEAYYSLEAGESFSSLTNFSENNSIKIRFFNSELDKEDIGFIRDCDCYSYRFPINSANNSDAIVLSVDATISFEDFLEELAYNLHERGIVGVYLEDSDYLENDISQIASFCEDLKIPYGLKSKFNSSSVQRYLDKRKVEISNDIQSYEILPQVFDVSSVLDGYSFEEDLSNCIFQASSVREDNIRRYWITSLGNQKISDDGILLMTFEKAFGFEYAIASFEFMDEVADLYNSLDRNL